jgi:hypothetical protein
MTLWSHRRVRVLAGVLTTLIVGAIFALELFGPSSISDVATEIAVIATPSPTAGAAVLGETSAPTEPPATPVGTPAPVPNAPVDSNASASVSPPPTPPHATPQPGLWRIEGYVVDDSGAPLANVCVVIGPHGCQRYSPHTDERGHYFLDVAARQPGGPSTDFDFYFEMPGHETVWWHFTAAGPQEFDVVLHAS